MHSQLRRLRDHPSAILLVSQVVAVLLYPFAGDSTAGRACLGVISFVVVGLALWAVRRTPVLGYVGVALGLPAVVLTIVEAFDPTNEPVVLTGALLHALFYFYVSYAMIRYLFADTVVTSDELFATGAAFTVVMWGFAYLFVIVETLWPGSYSPMPASHQFFDALFVSFTVLSGVGLSDIVPGTGQGRALMMLADLAGLMYVALVISRLVGLTIHRARQ